MSKIQQLETTDSRFFLTASIFNLSVSAGSQNRQGPETLNFYLKKICETEELHIYLQPIGFIN
jgi:hypothetical protein